MLLLRTGRIAGLAALALLVGCGGQVGRDVVDGGGTGASSSGGTGGGTGGGNLGGVTLGGAWTGGAWTGGASTGGAWSGGTGGLVPSCLPGYTLCGDTCINLMSNSLNCGMCGMSCPTGSGCSMGVCTIPCAADTTLCGTSCVDVRTSALHCGTCDSPCAAGFVCSSGTCTCPAGLTQCGEECVDTSTHPDHCGSCNTSCYAGATCTLGACICPPGESLCNGVCVDPSSDPANCGACGIACESGRCEDGECTDPAVPEGPSCAAGLNCNGVSCCTSIVLPAGSFPMGRGSENCSGCEEGCWSDVACDADQQPEHKATLSPFALDKFEVTVGRFRAFVAAYGEGWRPEPGAGANAAVEAALGLEAGASGWQADWDEQLPVDRVELEGALSGFNSLGSWRPTPGDGESWPINGATWFEAFAFCIWDEGRLPTEAEWEYAAAGGEENRVYPWGDTIEEPLPANYYSTHYLPYIRVETEPDGNGRWGHADLAGNLWEWVLDWYAFGDYYLATADGCVDCANLNAGDSRVMRGGSWDRAAPFLRTTYRLYGYPDGRSASLGFRCARAVP